MGITLNLKVRDFGYLGINGRIILKRILKCLL